MMRMFGKEDAENVRIMLVQAERVWRARKERIASPAYRQAEERLREAGEKVLLAVRQATMFAALVLAVVLPVRGEVEAVLQLGGYVTAVMTVGLLYVPLIVYYRSWRALRIAAADSGPDRLVAVDPRAPLWFALLDAIKAYNPAYNNAKVYRGSVRRKYTRLLGIVGQEIFEAAHVVRELRAFGPVGQVVLEEADRYRIDSRVQRLRRVTKVANALH